MEMNSVPKYAADPAYIELVKLCERCGLKIEYMDQTGTGRYARTDSKTIQMGMDDEYNDTRHAAIVLGHELAHFLEDTFCITKSELLDYEMVPYPNDNVEDLCDCWGLALYRLAEAIAAKQAEHNFLELIAKAGR